MIIIYPFIICNIFFNFYIAQNRSIFTGVATSVCYVSIFFSSFTFPLLSDDSVLDVHGSFWLYAAIGVLGLLFTIFVLPKDENSEWARLNPAGKGELGDVNMLKAGHHIGIDTIGQSLRNSNLQVRSEPANPQANVGPWNQTTIQPDLMRVPLELGCGPQ